MWKLLGLQISKGQMNIIHNSYFFFPLIYRMQQTEKTQVISTKQSYACKSLRGHTWEKQKLGWTELFHCLPCWGSSPNYNSQNPNASSGEGSLRPTTSKCSAFAPGKPEDIMPEVGITCGCTCKVLSFHLTTQLVPLFPPISGGEVWPASWTALFPGNPWHRVGAGKELRGCELHLCNLFLSLWWLLRPTPLPCTALLGTFLLLQPGTAAAQTLPCSPWPSPPRPCICRLFSSDYEQ